MKIAHCTVKEFSCEFCGQEFSVKEYLRNHIKKVHEGIKYIRNKNR